MINSKITRAPVAQPTTEERLFKILESIDWKLWEMYQIMKKQAEPEVKSAKTRTSSRKDEE